LLDGPASPPGGSTLAERRPGRIGVGCADRLNVADEPEAAPVQSPDEKLIGPVVAQHAPCAIDAVGECGFGDGPAIPDRVDQFILAHNPVMVAHEMNEEIEDLRLDVDGHTLAPQLMLAEVDFEIREPVLHYHLDWRSVTHFTDADRKQLLAEKKPTSRQEVRQA
jgi:hypothetical protein